ncbi:hypothetical protein HDU90_003247 [Geranomyces variabilis]|nr:hypothetical protein HDU90_003247 [Geranomyces variabilis]
MTHAAAATRTSKLTPENAELRDELEDRAATQRRILDREVMEIGQKFKHQEGEADWRAVRD